MKDEFYDLSQLNPANRLLGLVNRDELTGTVQLIHAINAGTDGGCTVRRTRWSIWMTGVGAGLGEKLFAQPGASATLCDFQVPYDNEIRLQAIHDENVVATEKAVSREAAIRLAMAAHNRLVRMVKRRGNGFWAMGITGALQTGRDRRGGDIVYFAVTDGNDVWTVQLAFQRKDERGNGWTREQQQLIVDMVGLELMLWAMGCGSGPHFRFDERLFPARLYSPERRFELETNDEGYLRTLKTFRILPTTVRRLWKDFPAALEVGTPVLLKDYGAFDVGDAFQLKSVGRGSVCLIPTSSRPLHEGHCWIRRVALELGMDPYFVITRSHAGGKPSVSVDELVPRSEDFLGRSSALFLQGPYLTDVVDELDAAGTKGPLFFMLGMDVAEKLLNQSLPRCLPDLQKFRERGVMIYVVVRAGVDKRLADLLTGPVAEYASLFKELDLNGPEISSTELRGILGMDRH